MSIQGRSFAGDVRHQLAVLYRYPHTNGYGSNQVLAKRDLELLNRELCVNGGFATGRYSLVTKSITYDSYGFL